MVKVNYESHRMVFVETLENTQAKMVASQSCTLGRRPWWFSVPTSAALRSARVRVLERASHRRRLGFCLSLQTAPTDTYHLAGSSGHSRAVPGVEKPAGNLYDDDSQGRPAEDCQALDLACRTQPSLSAGDGLRSRSPGDRPPTPSPSSRRALPLGTLGCTISRNPDKFNTDKTALYFSSKLLITSEIERLHFPKECLSSSVQL